MFETPKILHPLECHGVEFAGTSGEEWYGSCPFCLDGKHFYANGDSGQWDCKKCGRAGNMHSFLTRYHAVKLEDKRPLGESQSGRKPHRTVRQGAPAQANHQGVAEAIEASSEQGRTRPSKKILMSDPPNSEKHLFESESEKKEKEKSQRLSMRGRT